MLDKIRAIALEKLGSEEAADAFMEGFCKTAAENHEKVAANWSFGEGAAKAGMGIAGGLLTAGIVSGISTFNRNRENYAMRGKFDMALASVVSTNKIVKGARPEKVRDFAETFFSFAPHVASDPNLLGSILSNALLGESIDPQTIKTLVELEGRYNDNRKVGPLPGIKLG